MNQENNDRSSSLANDADATEMVSMSTAAKVDLDVTSPKNDVSTRTFFEPSPKNDVPTRTPIQTTSFFNPGYEQTFNETFRRTSLDCFNKVF